MANKPWINRSKTLTSYLRYGGAYTATATGHSLLFLLFTLYSLNTLDTPHVVTSRLSLSLGSYSGLARSLCLSSR